MGVKGGEHALKGVVDEAVVGKLVGVGVALADLFKDLNEALDGRVGGFVGIGQLLGVESEREEKEESPHGGSEAKAAGGRNHEVRKRLENRSAHKWRTVSAAPLNSLRRVLVAAALPDAGWLVAFDNLTVDGDGFGGQRTRGFGVFRSGDRRIVVRPVAVESFGGVVGHWGTS